MIENELYSETFKTPPGEKVLLELTSLYYDRLSYTRGDTHETAFREGQRSVVEFILRKLTETEQFFTQELGE